MKKPLEMDERGNVKMYPAVGAECRPVAGVGILLILDLVESPEELQTLKSHRVPAILSVTQAQSLADLLQTAAESLISQTAGSNDLLQ